MFFLNVVLDSLRACQTNDGRCNWMARTDSLDRCRLRHCTPWVATDGTCGLGRFDSVSPVPVVGGQTPDSCPRVIRPLASRLHRVSLPRLDPKAEELSGRPMADFWNSGTWHLIGR